MVVDAEGTLALSLEMDGLALWAVGRLLGWPLRWPRLAAGAVVGAIPTFMVLWTRDLYAVPAWVALAWPLPMAAATFGGRTARAWPRVLAVSYATAVAAAGVAALVWTWWPPVWPRPLAWLALAVAAPLAVTGGVRAWRRRARPLAEAEVELVWAGRVLRLALGWDTGNRLRDPVSRHPVVIVPLQATAGWLPDGVRAWAAAVQEHRAVPAPLLWTGRLGTVTYETIA
ncbi:MAG: sigma-E processing peptidase SpoIIGA, partial [Firmicutes bacterium]|nr:sigma-E processing peptidase SpoIIGA [Bacillota bacterium]